MTLNRQTLTMIVFGLTCACSSGADYWVQSGNSHTSQRGTVSDPYVAPVPCSGYLNALFSTNEPITVHLLPGTYWITNTIFMRSHDALIGAGMDATTISWTNCPRRYHVLSIAEAPDIGIARNLRIESFTLDCIGRVINGVFPEAVGSVERNVRVINTYTDTTNLESFGIGFEPRHDKSWDAAKGPSYPLNRVIDCQVVNTNRTQHNYISAICLTGAPALVRGCFVSLPDGTNQGFAYNCAGLAWGSFTGNASRNAKGFYTDTGASSNLLIADNVFFNTQSGVHFNTPHGVFNSLIANNLIIETSTRGRWPQHGLTDTFNKISKGNAWIGNRMVSTGNPSFQGGVYYPSGVVQGNVIDSPLGIHISTNTIFQGNFRIR